MPEMDNIHANQKVCLSPLMCGNNILRVGISGETIREMGKGGERDTIRGREREIFTNQIKKRR